MIKKLIHKFVTFSFSLFFPQRCPVCKKPDELFCDNCLSLLSNPHKTRTKYISLILSASRYWHPAIIKTVRAVKYRHASAYADILGEFLSDHVQEIRNLMDNDTIIAPIPISPQKLRIRGYNQSQKLAEHISKRFEWNIENALLKIKGTPSQTNFSSKRDRIKNIRGSFKVHPDFNPQGKIILLIDDVITSGATLNEAARILKQKGAKKIFAATVARG